MRGNIAAAERFSLHRNIPIAPELRTLRNFMVRRNYKSIYTSKFGKFLYIRNGTNGGGNEYGLCWLRYFAKSVYHWHSVSGSRGGRLQFLGFSLRLDPAVMYQAHQEF